RALIAPMVQRGHGHVVNIASLARGASRTGTYTGYAVSKRALTVLTESLGAALEGTGVVVIDVLPGRVRTAMSESMPVWKDLQPEDWDPAEATTSVVVAVARGDYDDQAGSLLDAPALHRGS
ncbi:MAG: SDR family NAD(P)-dependent oxidoreductase, partial [Actinomycetota bacterium]|nr:SDR family NAD(P)-dependent oxidoreductase [Actinomycetota bacterium]